MALSTMVIRVTIPGLEPRDVEIAQADLARLEIQLDKPLGDINWASIGPMLRVCFLSMKRQKLTQCATFDDFLDLAPYVEDADPDPKEDPNLPSTS